MVVYSLLAFVGLLFIAYLLRHQLIRLVERPVMLLFHYFYYRDAQTTWNQTKWMGVPLLKLPLDLWRYQDAIWETKPDLILEMGTNKGGSALHMAHFCDLLGNGRVVTVDIASPPEGVPSHPRIRYIIGSSTDESTVREIRGEVREGERVMVILDSDHARDHVRRELELYAPLVSPGCYLVVEDTNVNGHPVSRSHGPGPMEALNDFLSTKASSSFRIDKDLEAKYKITFYPRGWLKREAF